MSDDTYRELREYQRNKISLRARLEKRKRGVEDLLKSTGIENPPKQSKTEDNVSAGETVASRGLFGGVVTNPELESALLWYLGDISKDYPVDASKLPSRLARLGYRGVVSDAGLDELLDKLALQKLIDLVDEDGVRILSPLASAKSFRVLTISSARAEKIADLHSTLFPNEEHRWSCRDGNLLPESNAVLADVGAVLKAQPDTKNITPIGGAANELKESTDSGTIADVESDVSVSEASTALKSAITGSVENGHGPRDSCESSMKATSDIPLRYRNDSTTIISEQTLESIISSRSASIGASSSANGLGSSKKLGHSGSFSGKPEPPTPDSLESLLSLPSAKEKQSKKLGGEILDLLSRPTAKERSLVEKFRSADGSQLREFCPHGTKEDCASQPEHRGKQCHRLHFRKIIQKHTDHSLGDCSFLNTCFHMNTCKYIHYEVDCSDLKRMDAAQTKGHSGAGSSLSGEGLVDRHKLYPQQWIQCDLRKLDLEILGKFSVIMADPPWDIHMELPYGTMSDDEMRSLNIKVLQDSGLLFLWVTGRAMELGRECLKIWGYEQCDEIIWVKTNQLQRIIRTGRTGHWLNHGKEHCLVGYKGSLDIYNRGLDCDVIVGEVRETSHKPDEIYGLIERLSPGTRKLELFGRMHNAQKNWITLGNQLDGVRLLDPEVVARFKERYPDGNSMSKPKPK